MSVKERMNEFRIKGSSSELELAVVIGEWCCKEVVVVIVVEVVVVVVVVLG